MSRFFNGTFFRKVIVYQKNGTEKISSVFHVGIDLSSQAVASQVFSA